MMKKLYLIIIMLLFASPAWAACSGTGPWTAASCSVADISACITAAASCANNSHGDCVINVPAGTCEWDTETACGNEYASLCLVKGIDLVGAGVGVTNIKNTTVNNRFLIIYDPFTNAASNYAFRISGFSFDANGKYTLWLGHTSDQVQGFALQTKVRIDHNAFANTSATDKKGQSLWHRGDVYGVVDNNTFTGVNYPITNSGGYGDNRRWSTSPQSTFALGSANYLYYEDNTFEEMDGYAGADNNVVMNGEYAIRFVARYNTISNNAWSASLFEIHGEQTTPMDACFGAEVYGNNYTQILDENDVEYFSQRSGQVKVFMNNANMEAGLSGSFDINNSGSICPDDAYNALKMFNNSHYWRNRINYSGSTIQMSVTATKIDDCGGVSGYPTDSRDVFDDDSTRGIGCGNSLPATCTELDTYWLTSQTGSCTNLTGYVGAGVGKTALSGSLYKCTATDTWESYYVPYTYPHPLRGEAIASTISGMTASGVNIQ